MTTACTHCTRPAALFGCNRCIDELRDMLIALPGWITALAEEANGETRKGTSVRRSTDKGSPALCRLGKDGSFRGSPGQQQVYTHSVLVEWTRDICETRGIEVPILDDSGLALWLGSHTTAIASDQGFAVAYREFEQIIGDIKRIVDLPQEQRLCGRCPSILTDNYGERICNTRLSGPRESATVQCPGCKTTHNVEQLWEQQMAEVDGHSFTIKELDLEVLPAIRLTVPLRTLQHWVARNRLIPSGYDRDGEPRFLVANVRTLHAAKPQKLPTGAAADVYRKNRREVS